MVRTASLLVLLLFLGPLSGCVGTEALPAPEEGEGIPPPWMRSDRIYDDSDVFSRVTVNGTFAVGESSSVFVQVDTITAADGGAGLTGMRRCTSVCGCLSSMVMRLECIESHRGMPRARDR